MRIRRFLIRIEYWLKQSWLFAYRKPAKRVFYPGCSLPAADPELVWKTYELLKKQDPELGIVFDCCAKPVRMFLGQEQAERAEKKVAARFARDGVSEVVTACGNCAVQFKQHTFDAINVSSVYDELSKAPELLPEGNRPESYKVHHPCSARIDKNQQQSFTLLTAALNLNIDDTGKHPLACCLVKSPSALKKRAVQQDEAFLSYCGHCVTDFSADIPMKHVLQLVHGDDKQWQPQGKLAKFANYWWLARKIRRRT